MKVLLKRILVALVFSAALSVVSNVEATDVLIEDFDDDSQFTKSTSFFSDGSGDYLGIEDPADVLDDYDGEPEPSVLKAYTGFSGPYLTGLDLDGEGASLPVTISWTGLNIAGLTDLQFSGLFAEFFDSPGDIDEADELMVTAQIDGGSVQTLVDFDGADFSSTSGPFNGVFRLDGTGAALGDAAQSFSANIAGTGSTLDLVLTVSVNAGDEDFAVDSFRVTGTVVPEPTGLGLTLAGLLSIALSRRSRP